MPTPNPASVYDATKPLEEGFSHLRIEPRSLSLIMASLGSLGFCSDLRGSTADLHLHGACMIHPQSNRDALEATMKFSIEELAPDRQPKRGLRSWRLSCSWADGPMELEFAGYDTDTELFRWYLEKFATRDPLSAKKASGVEESLVKYREKICSLLRVGSFGNHGSPVVLDIRDNCDQSSFHSLPWEFLEHGSQAQRLVVRRRTQAIKDPLPDSKIQHQPETFNILLLAARSSDNDQAEYTQAALPIVKLLQSLPAGSSTVALDIVRPGSLAALKSHLQVAQEKNKQYHLVHLDLHGTVRKKV